MKTILIAMAFTLPSSPQIEYGEDPCLSERKINTYLSEVQQYVRNMDCQDMGCERDRVFMPLVSLQKWMGERKQYREQCHEKYGKPFRGRKVM